MFNMVTLFMCNVIAFFLYSFIYSHSIVQHDAILYIIYLFIHFTGMFNMVLGRIIVPELCKIGQSERRLVCVAWITVLVEPSVYVGRAEQWSQVLESLVKTVEHTQVCGGDKILEKVIEEKMFFSLI